jgi:hypothetical protein
MGIISSRKIDTKEVLNSIGNKHLLRIISDYYSYKYPFSNELLDKTKNFRFKLEFGMNYYFYSNYFINSREGFNYRFNNSSKIVRYNNGVWDIRC